MKTNRWYGRKFSTWIEMTLRDQKGDEWYLNNPPASFLQLLKYAQENKFKCHDYEYSILNRLRALGLPVEHQVIFFNRYIADIFLPGARTIIEIDGAYHKLRGQQISDKNRDEVFFTFGFDVHRWPMNLSMDELETKILAFRKAYSRFAKSYPLKPIVRPCAVEVATPEGLVQKALNLKQRRIAKSAN